MNATIFATKNRGEFKGERLYPHRHRDGMYVATTSKYEADYVRLASLEELTALVGAGYGARMSNPDLSHAPSYIAHQNIRFSQVEPEPTARLGRVLASFVESDELDRKSIATSRKEQAFLRAYLLKGKVTGCCVICGRSLPGELLVAAHIKPRAKCTRDEKLDFDRVAALMCKFGCDALFENGYIHVSDGKVRESPRRPLTDSLKEGIKAIAGRAVFNWPSSSAYYDWHAREFR